MGWLAKLFGRGSKESLQKKQEQEFQEEIIKTRKRYDRPPILTAVPATYNSFSSENTKRKDESNIDMLNPLNPLNILSPLCPLSPLWIGNDMSEGTHLFESSPDPSPSYESSPSFDSGGSSFDSGGDSSSSGGSDF